MKLVELVANFRAGASFEEFCCSQSLNLESEVIEIFMEKPFSVNNPLFFFEMENTKGKVTYDLDGIEYFYLFDFYYFLSAIEESNSSDHASLTHETIAQRLYDYGTLDA